MTEESRLGRIGFYSILVNLLLVGLKVGLAITSGSLALAADATDSVVDTFSRLAVLIGLIISQRKSKQFPYGLYKVENIVSIIIALLIFVAGYEIAREAIFAPKVELRLTLWLVVGVGATVVIPLLFGTYELRLGRKTGSPTLIADARHFQTDVLSSGVVLLALLASYVGLALDRIAAIIIVGFIGWSGWQLLVDGMRVLLDVSISSESLDKVRGIILSQPSVAKIKSLTGRSSGRYRFLEAEITLRIYDLEKAHQVSAQIEEKIRAELPRVERVLIRCEPREQKILRYAVPLSDSRGTVSSHFGEAPYFALMEYDRERKEWSEQRVVTNPYLDLEKGKGIRVAEWLVEQKVDLVLVRESLKGKGPEYVFADAGVELLFTEAISLPDAQTNLSKSEDDIGNHEEDE